MNGSLTTTNLAQRLTEPEISRHIKRFLCDWVYTVVGERRAGSFIEGAESSGLWAAFLSAGARFWEQMGAREVSEPSPREQNQTAPHTPQCLCYHHCMPPPPRTGVSPTSQEWRQPGHLGEVPSGGLAIGQPGSFPVCLDPAAASSSPPLPPGPLELATSTAVHIPAPHPHECTRLGQTPNLCLLRSAGLSPC